MNVSHSDIEKAKEVIKELLKIYNQFEREGELGNEDQARQTLIHPFIKRVLGWNTESLEEFRVENIRAGKRADCIIRYDNKNQFVLEAKAPSKEVFENKEAYEQAVQYGRYREKDFALLTNFRQWVILDCRIDKKDTILKAAIKKIDLEHANEEELSTLLCFEKNYWISSGKENKLYTLAGSHKPRASLDKELLDDMKRWRLSIINNIRQHSRLNKIEWDVENERMTAEEEVQKFIDRLVFICFCEDKELEEDPELKNILREKKEKNYLKPGYLLEEIQKLFKKYLKYNSDLFSKSDCDNFHIDDLALIPILEDLRDPKEKLTYDFSIIPQEVLGKVYENFLGHVLSGEKRIKEREDIGKRKKEGIYYTPNYIVEYIVNNTVREHIKNKTFEEINKVKILDPACGSGSFLLGAYNVLEEESEKRIGRKLNYEERKNLLLNCIYGVDLDRRAIKITELCFYLRIAERRCQLPELRRNIQHGNSLIEDKEVSGYNAFVWEERFPEIMKDGGFDIVVGNPPYVRPHNLDKKDKEYFWKHLKTFKAKSDLYTCFMEKGINLMKTDGIFSFIVPHTWTSLESFYEIRTFILETCRIVKLVQLPKKVFLDAMVETCIFVLSKEKDSNTRDKNRVKVEQLNEIGKSSLIKEYIQSNIYTNHLNNFQLYSELEGNDILSKIKRAGSRLGNFVEFFYGLKTGDDDKFIFEEPKNKECKKLIRSKDIGKYVINFDKKYVWYVPNVMIKNKSTARPGDKNRFENEKIIIARMGKRIVATYDDNNYYVKDGMLLLKKSESIHLKYFIALLNSKVINYYYKNYFITIDVLKNALLELPIVFNKEVEKELVELVNHILLINKQLQQLGDKQTSERAKIEEEIKRTDAEIDEIVYKIYGLTKEEIKIVEEGLK